MTTQQQKGEAFRKLHQGSGAFIIANAWDPGSARILTAAGFSAIASTSAGYAFSQGKQDNHAGREAIIRNAGEIAAATHLPVSADLENGFGPSPETVHDTIRMAAAAGLAGGIIEDATYDEQQPLYDIAHAADRIRAAAEAARAQPFPFVLTGRAENYLVGRPDLADVIKRLQAYQEAGAEVLYAPGITKAEEIRTLVKSVDRPVNVVMGLVGATHTVAALTDMGVRRISIGSGLTRAAYGALKRAAKEMLEHGTFSYAAEAMPYGELNALFSRASEPGQA